MKTITIIVPIDRSRGVKLLTLLDMFSKNAVVKLKDIWAIIPRSTFYALLYRLKLLAQVVKQRHSFDLFLFEMKFDFDNRKEYKIMRLNSSIQIVNVEGSVFVEFVKEL